MENEELLDLNQEDQQSSLPRRRKLLPWWIRFFCWVFMIMGGITPFAIVLGILGFSFNISLYGIETNTPLSVAGMGLTALFILKGATAFGLWTEKDWAIKLGYVDAIIGILVCIVVTFIQPMFDTSNGFMVSYSFRFELLFLVPYLYKLSKISPQWKQAGSAT